MRFVIALAALVAAGPALAEVSTGPAWSRATPGGAKNGAAYFEIRSDAADRLVAATSPVAERVELHTHINDGGVMRMREVEGGIAVAPGTPTKLEPGGLHVMLMGLKQPLKEGERFPLTLTFEKAGTRSIEVTVQKTAPPAHAH